MNWTSPIISTKDTNLTGKKIWTIHAYQANGLHLSILLTHNSCTRPLKKEKRKTAFQAKLFYALHPLHMPPNLNHDITSPRPRSSLLLMKQAAAADSTPSGRGVATSHSLRSSLQPQHAEGFRSLMEAVVETESATTRARAQHRRCSTAVSINDDGADAVAVPRRHVPPIAPRVIFSLLRWPSRPPLKDAKKIIMNILY
jgi:hypothetical protein